MAGHRFVWRLDLQHPSPILSQICIISGCRTRFGLLVTRWSPQAAAALTATRCAQICGCNRYIIGMRLTVLYTVMTHPTHINALFCIRTSLIFPPIMHPPMNTLHHLAHPHRRRQHSGKKTEDLILLNIPWQAVRAASPFLHRLVTLPSSYPDPRIQL